MFFIQLAFFEPNLELLRAPHKAIGCQQKQRGGWNDRQDYANYTEPKRQESRKDEKQAQRLFNDFDRLLSGNNGYAGNAAANNS